MAPPFSLAAICASLIFINPLFAYPQGTTFHVKAGESIQAAIDCANGGDKIVVENGTYSEQLTISTNGITLVGHNATIIPPSNLVTNTCTNLAGKSTNAGICVTGTGVVLQNLTQFNGEHLKVLSVERPVKDIFITGFTVKNFTGLNIAIVGAEDAVVTENTLDSSSKYGILTVGSENSHIKHNTVLAVPGFFFIGICMDDVSKVTIAHNDISGYAVGICVQTAGADIHNNKVHQMCVGAYVDPGIKGAKIRGNEFSNTFTRCLPYFQPSGIFISGSSNTVVKENKFSEIKSNGQAVAVVISDDSGTGEVASGNEVENNQFVDNDLDVLEQTKGAGNVVEENQCTLSNPPSLCQ